MTKRCSFKVMDRRLFGLVIFATIISGGFLGSQTQDASAITLSESTVTNPAYQRYLQDVSGGNGGNWKLIPQKYLTNVGMMDGLGNANGLPASYNLVSAGYGTTIKNQGADDACWAFATTTAIESNLKKTREITKEFSPKQLDYMAASGSPYHNYTSSKFGMSRTIGSGGNFFMASFPLAGQYSPVYESSFFTRMKVNDSNLAGYSSWQNYEDSTLVNLLLFGSDNVPAYTKPMNMGSVMGEISDYLVTDYQFYGREASVDDIKSDVYNYGAVYVGTFAPGGDTSTSCWDSAKKVVIDKGDTICGANNGHAMAIVGWDDNYTYTDGGTTRTGAFIVQNSYGKSDLFAKYGLTVDVIMAKLDEQGATAGLTPEQRQELRNLISNLIATYDAQEYIHLGYNYASSDTINFVSIREVRNNNYSNVYDLTALKGSTADTNGLTFNYATNGNQESIKAISMDTHAISYNLTVDYDIYVDNSGNGSNFQKVGSTRIEQNTVKRKTVDLTTPVSIAGDYAVRLVPMVNGEQVLIDNSNLPYFTVSVYTTGEEQPLPVPGTSTSDAPNAGMFTKESDGLGFSGIIVAMITVAVGAMSVVAVKERKTLFHRIKFEKKEF